LWVVAWVVVALTGCGRHAFDPIGDGASGGDDDNGTMIDADNRPPAIGPVAVQYTASNSCATCNSVVIPASPGPPDDPGFRRLVLVAMAAGLGTTGPTPIPTSVMYGNVPMNGAMRVVHPDSMIKPDLELWQLSDPPGGSVNVAIVLTGQVGTLEAGVIVIDGVHPTQPIRSFGSATGQGQASTTSSTVLSGAGDVVIDALCAGASIESQDPGNTSMIVEDQGNVSTCGNLEVGRQGGAASGLTTHWMVNGSVTDYWLQLQASIQPP
jgi:hypothetical protein